MKEDAHLKSKGKPMKRKVLLILGIILIGARFATGVEFYSECFKKSSETIFVSGFQGVASNQNNRGPVNTAYDPYAAAVGYIFHQDRLKTGISLSYEQGKRNYAWNAAPASANVQTYVPGMTAFSSWSNQDGFYVTTSAYLGFSMLEGRNFSSAGTTYQGNTIFSSQLGSSLETGKTFDLPRRFSLNPHLGLNAAHSPDEVYAPVGYAGPVTVKTQNLYEMPIGLNVSKDFKYKQWAIKPHLDLTMLNPLGTVEESNAIPAFASRTGDKWNVYGVRGDRIDGRIKAGVNAEVGDRTNLGLNYSCEGRREQQDHQVSATFGLSF